MTRDQRRYVEHLKDKRRRKLYLSGVLKGRYEVPGEPLTPPKGYADSKYLRETLVPWNEEHVKQIKSGKGHWQEYPKTKNYGSNGYKHNPHKKVRQNKDYLNDIEEKE